MTVAGHRPERLAEEIRNELSLMLAGELKDPRLAIPIDITEVRLDSGMRTVRVFVQVTGGEPTRAEALDGLKAASGYIRHDLAERLQLRRAPEVIFIGDQSAEYGRHIDDLLREVHPPEKT